MGSKDRYEELRSELKTIQQKQEKMVNEKFARQRAVAQSILRKKMGAHWKQEDLNFLGDYRPWLLHGDSTIVSLEEYKIIFQNDKLKSTNPGGKFSIHISIIRQSDRDFAKRIRSLIYERKRYLKGLEISNAAEELKKAEAAIKSLELKKIQLSNIQSNQEKLLAKLEQKAIAKSERNLERKRSSSQAMK